MHILYLSLQRGKESTSHQKVERPQWIIQIGFVYVPLKLRAEKVKQHFFLIVQTLCHQHRLLVFRINLCKLVIVPGGFFAIITVIIIVIIIITISLFLMHAPYTYMMQRIRKPQFQKPQFNLAAIERCWTMEASNSVSLHLL